MFAKLRVMGAAVGPPSFAAFSKNLIKFEALLGVCAAGVVRGAGEGEDRESDDFLGVRVSMGGTRGSGLPV